ncbi:MAG TPA: hypothetical protein VM285_06225, partial [Polyangia bacterium]|nr:hypothetical protein [Polyangia bacterium]
MQNHWKTADLWRVPELRATYIGLGLLAIERFAQHTGDTMLIGGADLQKATGCGTVSAAVRRMDRLVAVAAESWRSGPVAGGQPEGEPAVTWGQAGSGWRVTLPNLLKNQAFRKSNVPLGSPSYTYPYSDTNTKSPRPKKSPPKAPTSEGVELAEALSKAIRETDPEAKIPDSIAGWARTADLMLSRDHRKREEVLAGIEWLKTE